MRPPLLPFVGESEGEGQHAKRRATGEGQHAKAEGEG
jgi:hypothetical protein